MRSILLLLFSLFIYASAWSQNGFSTPDWQHYDSMVQKKSFLETTRLSLDSLRKTCLEQQRYAEAARSWLYLIAIEDARTEDTLFFINSYPIDSVLQLSNAPEELLFCFQLMQASRLKQFAAMSKRFEWSKYRNPAGRSYFSELSVSLADSVIATHFIAAMELAKNLPREKYRHMIWLSNDPGLFLFKPTAFDIAMANFISWQASRSGWEFAETLSEKDGWQFSSSDQLAEHVLNIDSCWLNSNKTVRLYGQWMRYWQNEKSILRYLESLLRKWLNSKVQAEPGSVGWLNYNRYLLEHVSEPFPEAKMHAALQLVQRWTDRSRQYLPMSVQTEANWHYGSYSFTAQYDTSARLYADSALAIWNQVSATADSFQLVRQMALDLLYPFTQPSVRFRMPQVQLPGEPLLVETIYRHAASIRLLVYRKAMGAMADYLVTKSPTMPNGAPVWQTSVSLPETGDANEHLVHLKLNALPPGHYALYITNDTLISSGKWLAAAPFQVSNLQVLTESTRVFVVNRKSGQPISGARVQLYSTKKNKLIATAKTGHNGSVNMKAGQGGKLLVSLQKDSIQKFFDFESPEKPDEVFSRGEYDDRLEFYDDNAMVHIYLDRGIYRPGDTVFFKTVLLTRNPVTGEWMLVTKKNLRNGRLFSLYQKLMREADPWLYVQDPFGGEQDSLKLNLNEFASQAGRFVLPLTAATGEWNIESDYFNQEGGSFRVEEYKRPSYEITIKKPVDNLLPGDSFSFAVNLRAFSGAPMNAVNVKYRVLRTLISYSEIGSDGRGPGYEQVILDSTAQSSHDGTLSVLVSDSIWKMRTRNESENISLRYKIEVKVTDATGETYEASELCSIMSQPISITMTSGADLIQGSNAALRFRLNHINAGAVEKAVRVQISKAGTIKSDGAGYRAVIADQFIHPKDSLKQWFSTYFPEETTDPIAGEFLLDTLLPKASPMLQLAGTGLLPGNYNVKLSVSDGNRLLGQQTATFSLYALETSFLPLDRGVINLDVSAFTRAGDTVTIYSGSNEQQWSRLWHYRYFDRSGRIQEKFEWTQAEAGLQKWKLLIPANISGSLYLTGISVLNNQVYEYSRRIQVEGPVMDEPEIVIERYRRGVEPGSKERFEVSVQKGNSTVLAELMTTMYDASLDKLEKLRWSLPDRSSRLLADADWQTGANSFQNSKLNRAHKDNLDDLTQEGDMFIHGEIMPKSLFWYNPGDYSYSDDMPASFGSRGFSSSYDVDSYGVMGFIGRMPGVAISSAEGLQDVVVVGYGAAKRLSRLGAQTVTVRGVTSLKAYAQPLVLLDGVVFSGDLSSIDPATIVAGMVLKGGEAAAIYGARAANGVLLLSTKGEIVLPVREELPAISRKNFSTSAFFFPQLRANKDGRYVMSFTMPESVTEWNWKMMAHTANAEFTVLERLLRSSLPLMVQASLPRFVYAGDSVVVSARVSNLDSMDQEGIVEIQLLDENGNPQTGMLQRTEVQLKRGSSMVVEFPLKIDAKQLDVLTIRMAARSSRFADAEEHRLPVLQKEVWAQLPKTFMLAGYDSFLTRPSAISLEKWKGTAISIKKEKAAELFEGLAYLSAFELDCAEQLTNKIFADMLAWRLLQKDTVVQDAFAKAEKLSAMADSQKDRTEPPEQTSMPWLSIRESEAEQAYRKWNLFDTSRIESRLEQNFTKLFRLQTSDGGLSWFPGGESDAFISAYVLRKLGALKEGGEWQNKIGSKLYAYQQFQKKLLQYVDTLLSKPYTKEQERTWLSYIHARSYWLSEQTLNVADRAAISRKLAKMADSFDAMPLEEIARLAISYHRLDQSDSARDRSRNLWANLVQRSIRDKAGMRWREFSNMPVASGYAEEQLLQIAEALKIFETDSTMLAEVARWLLDTRQQRSWRSTRSISAFIELLQMAKLPLWTPAADIIWLAGKDSLRISSNPLENRSQQFSGTTAASDNIQLRKQGNGAVAGRVIWHYLTDSPEQNEPGKLALRQQWSRWNDQTSSWQQLADGDTLALGQKVACEIIIDAKEPVEYVQLESFHPACANPFELASEYRSSKGWRYYQSVRSERIDLFATSLPEGRTTVLLEFRIEKKGVFQVRPAVLRAMYDMGLEAYGSAGKFVVQ